jgi:hypothetical protein
MNVTLGQAAKQAVVFLEQFYRDVHSLVLSMDGAMLERGWQPTERKRISTELGNHLNSRHWVLNSLYRLYFPAGEEQPKRVIAVQIVFSPEDYDEPMILVAAVRYEIWSGWYSSDQVLRFLAGSAEPRELSDELREGFIPGSEHAEAFVIPLCELTSADVLSQRLLDPALTLVNG